MLMAAVNRYGHVDHSRYNAAANHKRDQASSGSNSARNNAANEIAPPHPGIQTTFVGRSAEQNAAHCKKQYRSCVDFDPHYCCLLGLHGQPIADDASYMLALSIRQPYVVLMSARRLQGSARTPPIKTIPPSRRQATSLKSQDSGLQPSRLRPRVRLEHSRDSEELFFFKRLALQLQADGQTLAF